jgi:hypothetical protein
VTSGLSLRRLSSGNEQQQDLDHQAGANQSGFEGGVREASGGLDRSDHGDHWVAGSDRVGVCTGSACGRFNCRVGSSSQNPYGSSELSCCMSGLTSPVPPGTLGVGQNCLV